MVRKNSIFGIRHTLTSLAILVLLSGTGFGILGFASADGNVDDVGAFTFVQPMAGDNAVYKHTDVSDQDRPWEYNRGPNTIEVIIAPDRLVSDAEGRTQKLNTYRVVEDWDDERYDRDVLYHLIPGTTHAVSYTQYRDETELQEGGRELTVTSAFLSFQERPEDATLCGTITALQGMTVPMVESTFVETTICRASGTRVADGDLLHLLEGGEEGGVKHVMVQTEDPEGRPEFMRYWYQEGIPFPIRVEEHDQVHQRTWELTSFLRGTEEILRVPDVSSVSTPAPKLAFAPRTEHGIDTTGVDHPFPPDEALQIAKDDAQYSGLRDYLAAHPDAEVISVIHQNHRAEGRDGDWDIWNYQFTDGEAMFDLQVRRIIQDSTPAAGEEGPLSEVLPEDGADDTEPAAVPSYDFSDRGIEEHDPYSAHPSILPDNAPTWKSMLAAWEHHRGQDYADVEGNHLRFHYNCHYEEPDSECTKAEAIFQAGYSEYTREYTSGPTSNDYEDDLRMSTLEWREIPGRDDYTYDQPIGYTEHSQAWRPVGILDEVTTSSAAPERTSSMPVAAVWDMPALGATVAVGFVGFLVAIGHWLAPAFKGGALGLFSRIRNDQVLEHPMRQQLADAVAADPGVHHQELVRRVGAGKGAVEMHLLRLERAGTIDVVRTKGYTCYFPHGKVDRRVMAIAPVLKSEVARAIVNAAAQQPHIGMTRLRAEIGVAPSTLHYHISRLEKAGAVEVHREGNGKVVDITPFGVQALAA